MANDVLQQELAAPVVLSLGGVDYVLSFPLLSVLEYKQATGDNLFVLSNWAKIDPANSPENFLAALLAAIHPKNPDMTEEQLASLVNFGNSGAAAAALVSLLKSYFPNAETDADASPNDQSQQVQ